MPENTFRCSEVVCGTVCHLCLRPTTLEGITGYRLTRVGGAGLVHWYHVGCLLRHWFDDCTRPECVRFYLRNRDLRFDWGYYDRTTPLPPGR